MKQKDSFLVYGLISGISVSVVSVFSLILYLTGMAFAGGVRYFSFLPLLVCLILNGVAFSKANDGYVTFGNVYLSCFKASLISGVILLAYNILCLIIFPGMKDKAMEMASQQMDKNPAITDDARDMAMNITRKGYTFIMIFRSIIGSLISGAIFSLTGGAVAKKKGPKPFGMDNI